MTEVPNVLLEAPSERRLRPGDSPRWAAVSLGGGLASLTVAIVGFYWDVGWHVDFGRDRTLFTVPHTMVVAVFGMLAATAAAAITAGDATSGVLLRGRRVPLSALALGTLGVGALAAFPLDQIWHRAYGPDVSLWTPSHLLMMAGPSLAPVAIWLALGEAGIPPVRDERRSRLHLVLAVATLLGLSSFGAEFDLGVVQFPLLYHPALVSLTAGVVLVCARAVLGPLGAARTAIGFLGIRVLLAAIVGPGLGHTVPHAPLYLGAALAVEAAAYLLGTERAVRFAVAAGSGIATAGIATEAWWSQLTARHAWTVALFPDAIVVAALTGIGGALVGIALARGILRGPLPGGRVIAAAALAIVAGLAIPFPRSDGRVAADLSFERAGSTAVVTAALSPASAAEQARWFEVLSWQGGGIVIAPMVEVAAGRYVSDRPVPVSGSAKTLLRLHRGSEMLAIPLAMPADPSLRLPAVTPQDRRAAFAPDATLFMRDTSRASSVPRFGVLLATFAIASAMLLALSLTVLHVSRRS
jgi:hypothetical protein